MRGDVSNGVLPRKDVPSLLPPTGTHPTIYLLVPQRSPVFDHELFCFHLSNRVAAFAPVLFLLDTLLILGASFTLYGKLRSTNDIYHMSREIRIVGAFALLALGKGAGLA